MHKAFVTMLSKLFADSVGSGMWSSLWTFPEKECSYNRIQPRQHHKLFAFYHSASVRPDKLAIAVSLLNPLFYLFVASIYITAYRTSNDISLPDAAVHGVRFAWLQPWSVKVISITMSRPRSVITLHLYLNSLNPLCVLADPSYISRFAVDVERGIPLLKHLVYPTKLAYAVNDVRKF